MALSSDRVQQSKSWLNQPSILKPQSLKLSHFNAPAFADSASVEL
ncbi:MULTISPECIES: hypothetical protein [Trichocoleus]|nr:hypothetical protein [Trichocoleus sp. FACHB-46]